MQNDCVYNRGDKTQIIVRKPVFKIRFFGADLSSQAELFTSKKLPELEQTCLVG